MRNRARVLLATLIAFGAFNDPLAAHTGAGGNAHELLHLLWGNHHTSVVAVFGVLAVAGGVALAIKLLGRYTKA